MKQFYVYMLKCRDNSIYVGLTNNIERRLEEHQKGFNKESYTYSRRPLQLIFQQEFIQYKQAKYFETKIKKMEQAEEISISKW